VTTVLDTAKKTVSGSSSIVAFERYADTGFGRRLTVAGRPAYNLSPLCDTCDFIFERMEGANQSAGSEAAEEALRRGLDGLEAAVVEAAASALPDGDYRVALLDVLPRLVWPGDESDYFTHEQLDVWEIDPFWGLPHNPKVPYFRTDNRRLPPDALLFEFVVPMFPPRWLNSEAVDEHRERAERGEHATALAVSVLDVRQPADWEGDPEITKHWCLAHFLLDGNHRVYAASEAGATVRILSFLSLEWSIATPDEIEQALLVLGQPPDEPSAAS
jgi:hypothetical protein